MSKKHILVIIIITLLVFIPLNGVNPKSFGTEKETLIVFSAVPLPDSFNDFKSLKESEGFNVILLKPNELQGENKILALRDYIKDNIDSLNIKYLMIVGSDYVFPMVRFFPRGDGRSDELDEYFSPTPSDIFFSCVDEDFDKDGDEKFGEYPDDNIEISPEVFVGRIPIDEKDKLDNYFTSLVNFEKLPFNMKNRALLLGAYLSFDGQEWVGRILKNSDGGEFMEKIINEILIKNRITPIRLYEDNGTLPSAFLHDYPLNKNNVRRLLEKETFSLIDINAHGSPNSVARYVWEDKDGDLSFSENEAVFYPLLSTSDLPNKINGGVAFAASCLTAVPEVENSLAKTFLERGLSVYIGATRVSWGPSYWKDLKDGGLLTINYLFVENFIDKGESVGEAFWNAISEYHKNYFDADKEDPIDAAQMNTYTFNLFGDPTLKIEKDETSPFMKRYTTYGFKGDIDYVPVNLSEDDKITPFERKGNGFIVKNLSDGEYEFKVNDIPMSFHFYEIRSPVYIYPEEKKNELYLHIYGNKKVVIHFSDGLRFKKCFSGKIYHDPYRKLVVLDKGEVVVFEKLKDNFSFSLNRGDVIIFDANGFDYNRDFIINDEDIFIFSHHFGLDDKDSTYNKVFDLNDDGIIDGEDLIELSSKYGEIRRQE